MAGGPWLGQYLESAETKHNQILDDDNNHVVRIPPYAVGPVTVIGLLMNYTL